MEQASIESVKIYANELMSYGLVICYLIDVAIGVLLWRGRANLWLGCTTVNIWFPIHSIALLTAVSVAIEMPKMIPAVFFFGIAYMLLAMNYYGSRYPYPWNRCKVSCTLLYCFRGPLRRYSRITTCIHSLLPYPHDVVLARNQHGSVARA